MDELREQYQKLLFEVVTKTEVTISDKNQIKHVEYLIAKKKVEESLHLRDWVGGDQSLPKYCAVLGDEVVFFEDLDTADEATHKYRVDNFATNPFVSPRVLVLSKDRNSVNYVQVVNLCIT